MTLKMHDKIHPWKTSVATASAVLLGVAGLSQAQTPPTAAPASPTILAPADSGTILPYEGAAGQGPADPARAWFDAEYLLWWVRGQALPPLVTTSPAGTPQAVAGLLGQPTTSVLFGDSRVNDEARSGMRFNAGLWLDDCNKWAVGGEFFMLETEGSHFNAASNGDPILARPFFNVLTQAPGREIVAFPGVASGQIDVGTRTELLGAGLFLQRELYSGCGFRIDGLVGYRYLRLKEGLGIGEDVTSTAVGAGVIPTGTTFDVVDQFNTENRFNGVDLGLLSHFERGRVFLNVLTKVALGDTERHVNINGSTTITVPGAPPASFSGGLLALDTNIGRYKSHTFSTVPELRIDVGYQVTEHLRAWVGYDLLYWSDVARPGEQVNLNVNPNFIPPVIGGGPAAPTFQLHESNLWVQGINFGLGLRF